MGNIIVLKSAYNKTPGQEYYIQPARKPNGQWPESVRDVLNPNEDNPQMILSESDKEFLSKGGTLIPAYKSIKVKHGQTFDLDDPTQAAIWEAIKYSSFIAKDRFATDSRGNYLVDGEQIKDMSNQFVEGLVGGHQGVADLYVEHPGIVSKVKNDRKKLIHKAEGFVLNDTIEGWITKCKLLEKDMSKANASDVEDYLLTQAGKFPEKIIDLYTGTNTALRLLLVNAQDKGVVVKKNNLLMYADDIVLGTNIDRAIAYLSEPDHIKIKEMIQQETFPELYKKTPLEKAREAKAAKAAEKSEQE